MKGTAYILKDKAFGSLTVRASANAWWMDRVKLNNFITALKYGTTLKEACILSGISEDQYKYFKRLHPEFSPIIDLCRNLPGLRARKTVIDALDTDLPTARWYLERKYPEEFGRKEKEYTTRSVVNFLAGDRNQYSL